MARNELYESTLERQGVEFEYYENLPLDDIDEPASEANQVRLEEVIYQDLVDQYADSYRDLCEMPPLVVHRSPTRKTKYVIDDGNHRFKAMKRINKTHSSVYILHTDDLMIIERIRGSFNNQVNGARLSLEETIIHAANWALKWNVPYELVVKYFPGVKASTLANYVRVQKARAQLHKLNVKVKPTMTDAHIMAVAPLANIDDNLFARTVTAVGNIGSTVSDIQDLVRQIKKAPSIAEKNEVVDDYVESPLAKQRRAETKGGTVNKKVNTLRDTLCKQMKALQKTVEDHDYESMVPPDAMFKVYQGIAESISHHMVQMFKLDRKGK